MDRKSISLDEACWRLLVLWLALSGATALLVIAQSVSGKYGEQTQEVWGWLIPATLPTLSLMVGAVGARAMGERDQRTVDLRYFRLSWWISLVYLGLLVLSFLLQPLTRAGDVAFLHLSSLWLSPVQGLVVATLGFLFNKQEKKGV